MNRTLSVGMAGYVLLIYWGSFVIIHLTVDLFIDLHTDKDYIGAFWLAVITALPLAASTIYLARKSLFTSWYTYVLHPLIVYGLYLGSAYFTLLKLDLLVSAAIRPETEQVVLVKNVQRVFAHKAGFIHTKFLLGYHQQQLAVFEGTRSSYFLLKNYKALHVKIGRSYLGSYYITHIDVPDHERWAARWSYLKDWIHRYYWLMLIFPFLLISGIFKEKFFPASTVKPKLAKSPFNIFLKRLFIIILTLLCLFVLIVLFLGFFG